MTTKNKLDLVLMCDATGSMGSFARITLSVVLAFVLAFPLSPVTDEALASQTIIQPNYSVTFDTREHDPDEGAYLSLINQNEQEEARYEISIDNGAITAHVIGPEDSNDYDLTNNREAEVTNTGAIPIHATFE